MEDWEMHGVNPFRKIHRYTDYLYSNRIVFFFFTEIITQALKVKTPYFA